MRLSGRSLRVVGAGVGLAVLLAACSSNAATPATTSTTKPSSASSPTTSVVVPPYSAAKNARTDARLVSCADNPGTGWVAIGTVTNSAATPRAYVIAVDIVTATGDTVQATQVLHVPTVQPGKTTSWATTPALPGKTGLACVIREVLVG